MPVKKSASARVWRDPDDAPELTNENFFDRAQAFVGETLIPRGRGRPRGSAKVSTTVRFDVDVIEAFRAHGNGWQTRMNTALREWLALRERRAARKSPRKTVRASASRARG